MKTPSYISRNLCVLVSVPLIIAGHYAWYRLQKVDALVSEEERKQLPFASLLFGKKRSVYMVSGYAYETREHEVSYVPFYEPDYFFSHFP